MLSAVPGLSDQYCRPGLRMCRSDKKAMFVNIMKYGGLWDLPVQMARMSMVHVRSSDMSDKIWVDDCQLMLNSLLTCE